MGVKVFTKITGIDKLEKSFQRLQRETLKGQVEAVQLSTLRVHEESVKLLQDNTDGTPEIRYSPKRVVNVSKPGDPPNTDTGRAVQSIKFDFKLGGLVGRVGSNLKYLAWLEFGTEHIRPRPWLSTAVKNVSKEVAKIFETSVSKVINGFKK